MADQNRLPRLDDTHFFFADISCTQTYGSRGPNVWFTRFYSSIAAFFGGSFNRLMVGFPEHLRLVKLFSKALQMLQQLSILHQEDENERAQSLAANDGSNESWNLHKNPSRPKMISRQWPCSRWRRLEPYDLDLQKRWSDYILPFEGIWCRRKRTKMRRKTRTLSPPIDGFLWVSSDDFFLISWQDTEKELFPGSGDDVSLYHPKFPMFFFLWWSFNMSKNQRDLLWGEDKAEAYAMLGLNEDGYLKVWWFLWFFCETVTHWYLWQMRHDFYKTFWSKFFCDAGWNNKWWSWCSRI